jgi:ubiquinone/menaquinone biosynthesis C-methylase UbiE
MPPATNAAEPASKKAKIDLGLKVENEKVLYSGFDNAVTEYCPYDDTSKTYDNTRSPLGLNIVLGSLALNDKPLSKQKVLDVGCGTGTFMDKVQGKVQEIQGVEYNDGMLAQARALLGQTAKLVQASATALPFADESFDAVVMNQVLHHFPQDNGYAFLEKFLAEAFRVLQPGGHLVINTSAPEQQRDSFWWLSLFPKASETICTRFPPIATLTDSMRAAGFQVDADSVVVPLQRTLMTAGKYLAQGVHSAFSAEYRAGDSSWSMAENSGELQDGLAALQKMIDEGTADSFLKEREALRLSKGQATFVTATKK